MPNYGNVLGGMPSPYPRNAITDYNPYPELLSGVGPWPATPGRSAPNMYYSPTNSNWMSGAYYDQEMQDQARMKAGPGAGQGTQGVGFTAQIDPISGFYVNPSTRQPFSGVDASGRSYRNGRLTGEPVPYDASGRTINPNDPNQRYRAVDIIKSPDVAAGESELMSSFRKGAQDSMKGFDDWLNTFKTSLGTAFSRSQAANDPTATIGTLRGNQSRYDTAMGQAQQNYADLNARTAAQEQALVAEARGMIPMYDKAAQDAADQALNRLQANVSRYKAASGTPMSLGSAEEQQILKGAADILVPMEQAKIAQRYNVLDRYAMPATLDIANRETQRIGSFDPMVAREQFQSGNWTAQTIQGLLQSTAQMSRQDAIAYMQALAVPAQVQQAILSGQIQQLGALGQIEEQSRYRGLQDILGAQLTPSQYYSGATGAYPNMGRYTPTGMTGGTANTMTAPNAPISTGTLVPGGRPDVSNNPYGYAAPTWASAGGGGGSSPQTFQYDPDTGGYYNRYTGAFSPGTRFPGAQDYYQPELDALNSAMGNVGISAALG